MEARVTSRVALHHHRFKCEFQYAFRVAFVFTMLTPGLIRIIL